jgi:6,7-dimethyl-8-ribityllumazine synthase
MTSSEETKLDEEALAASTAGLGAAHFGVARRSRPRLAVVAAKFNGGITQRLFSGLLEALDESGADRGCVSVAWVPGAFEIPVTAARLAACGEFDAVVALGAVIRGDTAHFDFVAGECASGCQKVAVSTGVPVIFGVLTTEDVDQALVRSAPGTENKGYEAALAALEMVDLLAKLPKPDAGVD